MKKAILYWILLVISAFGVSINIDTMMNIGYDIIACGMLGATGATFIFWLVAIINEHIKEEK